MGGNIFKDAQGNSLTGRISYMDTITTIEWLESIIKIPLMNNMIGSTGQKDSTGDIDLVIDENKMSKDRLIQQLNNWLKLYALNPKDYIKKSGISVHFFCPVIGIQNSKYVQVDFMFTNDIDFMKKSLTYNANSSFSGADRNLFMSSIAKSIPGDYKYSWQKGLINRSDSKTITKNMNEIAKFLLGDNHTEHDLSSLELILESIKDNKQMISNLSETINRLNDSTNKKNSEIKSDLEEATRIKKILDILD